MLRDNLENELRKLLDERGIEYAESQDRFRTRFRFNYCEACGDYLNEIEVMGACITASKSYLTPKQAIAATLDKEGEAMSMLSQQAKALRSWADQFAEREDEFGVVARALVADLRETAEIIESMQDSRWHELFGTPERAARTMAGKCGDCFECVLENDCEYGCDEGCLLSNEGDYDALLEWLKQEVDA